MKKILFVIMLSSMLAFADLSVGGKIKCNHRKIK